MNSELQLKIQAYLDGELAESESRQIAELVARDAEAAALLTELKNTKSAFAAGEADLKLPESREFYWSKIQRQIERVESTQADGLTEPPSRWWPRFLAPAGVLAGLAIFVAVVLRNPDGGGSFLALDDSHEIETPLEETSSFSFRSEAAAMTVVWVDSHRE